MGTPPSSLKLGFAGTPGFAVPALDVLARSPHEIAAVFTKPDGAAGRGQALRPSAVKKRALELGLHVLQPSSLRTAETLDALRSLELDALIVVAYGLILPAAALAASRLGCFNIHASLLPRWRGAAPVQRALLAGDAVTGITIMRMDEGLDTGAVVDFRATEIEPQETAGSLHERLAGIGAELMRDTLDEIAAGRTVEVPQASEGVTYAAKIHKSEAKLDWREDCSQILRRIRAFNPTPVAETRWADTQLRIWEALPSPERPGAAEPGRVLSESPAGIDVACGGGAIRITRLQLAGRRPLAAAEFLRAQRLEGARFGNS